jgi:hypothetical protein
MQDGRQVETVTMYWCDRMPRRKVVLMFSRLGRHVRQQFIGYIALFIALGGISYAAVTLPNNSVTSKQIRNGTITSADLKNNKAVKSIDVVDGSLLGKDFKAGELVAGAPGPQGSPGPKGDTGATGSKGDQGIRGEPGVDGADGAPGSKGDQGIQGEPGVDGADGAPGPSDAWSASYNDYDYSGNRAISVTVPAGHFVVNAKGSIYSTDGGTGLCTLTGGGGDPLDQAYSHTSADKETTYPVQGVRSFPTGGTLTYECTAPGGTLRAVGWMKLTAIKVGALH